MMQENLNELSEKKLDLDISRHFYPAAGISLIIVFLIFGCLDLYFYFQGEKLGFSLSLLTICIIFVFIPILYLSKMVEPKNPLSWLILNDNYFVLEYKNGYQKQINVSDIEKVSVDIIYGKPGVCYVSIFTPKERTLLETSMFRNIFQFFTYLNDRNIDIEYSNKIVEVDVKAAIKNPKKHQLLGMLLGIFIAVLFIILLFWLF